MTRSKQESLFLQAKSRFYSGKYPLSARPAGGSQGLTTSITRFEHTVNFATDVNHGQFINGDYWILDPGSGVQAISKLPAPSTDVNGYKIHGVMKNPTVGGNQGLHQSQFNSNGTPNTNVAHFWDETENLSFPITLVAGDRLILGKSRESGQLLNWHGEDADKDPVMHSYVVITVVGEEPSATAFRPCPADPAQTMYDFADVIWSRLPTLSTAAVTLPTDTGYDDEAGRDANFGYYERGSERGVPVWFTGWRSRMHHPIWHSEDYHEQIGKFWSNCFGLLCTDVSQARKEQLLINMIQQSLDYYGVNKQNAGSDSSTWILPVIFGGFMLGDDAIRDCFLNGTVTTRTRELEKVYYDADRLDTARTYNGSTTDGIGWSGYKVFFRKAYVASDEFETRMPAEWSSGDGTDESYRRFQDVEPFHGMSLAAQAMGLRAQINHDAVFETTVRWIVDTDTAAETAALAAAGVNMQFWGTYTNSAGSNFLNDMWNAHAATWSWPDQGGQSERWL